MLTSKNPYTEEVLKTFEEYSDEEIETRLKKADAAFQEWKLKSFDERKQYMLNLSRILKEKARELGMVSTLEMGKPLKAAIAEVEKSSWVCEHFANTAEEYLKPEKIETDASESYVRFDPVGPVLAVMPWNFPYNQVIKFAAPALMAGNVGLLKHASNVPQVTLALEAVFREAGFPDGVFQVLLIGSDKVDAVIRDERIKGVSLTGSEKAGASVASTAASEIKKSVLELGGSDPFIVLEDADIAFTCEIGVNARVQNSGQSCIAAKRFIVMRKVADEFISKYKEYMQDKKVGDPTDESIDVGPLAMERSLEDVLTQIEISVEKGAKVILGGKRHGDKGYILEPTIITSVTKDMPVYYEEVFAPVTAVIIVDSEEEAIQVANDTRYGLGASIWTKDVEKGKKIAARIDAGNVFVNGMVKSDPRLPFGGTKKSGFGRELSEFGIREFVNIKTVWVK